MAAPTVQAVGTPNHGTGAVTYTLPAHATNDILLLVVECSDSTGVTAPTQDSGWAHVTNSPRAQGSNVTCVNVMWIRATSGAMTNPQVPTGPNHQIGVPLVIRGAVTSGNPWDFSPVGNGAASATSVSATGGTTTVADTLVVVSVADNIDTTTNQFSSGANATLSSFTEQVQSFTTDGNGGGIVVYTGTKAATGGTGTTTVSIPSATYSALTLAIKPSTSQDETGSVTLTGSGTLDASGSPAFSDTLTLSGSGGLSASGTVAVAGTLTLSASGALAASGSPSTAGSAALSGSGTLDASGVPSNFITSVTSQLFDGDTPLGSPVSHDLSTDPSNAYTTFDVAGVTLAQLQSDDLNVRHVVTRGPNTSETTVYVDSVRLDVDYLTATSAAYSGSGSFSGSGTLTASGSPSFSDTLTLSGSGTLTAAGAPSPASTLTLSGSGALTSEQVAVAVTGEAALSGSGTLTPSQEQATASGTLTLTGSGTLAPTGAPSYTDTLTLSGSGTLTLSDFIPAPAQTLALSGSGTLTTTQEQVVVSGTLGLTGSGSLTSSATVAASGDLTLSGSGTLAPTGAPAFTDTLTLTGSGTLTAAGAPGPASTVSLSGSGSLDASGVPSPAGALDLTGSGTLDAFSGNDFSRSADLTGSGTLAASGSPSIAGTLDLSGSGTLAAYQLYHDDVAAFASTATGWVDSPFAEGDADNLYAYWESDVPDEVSPELVLGFGTFDAVPGDATDIVVRVRVKGYASHV